MPVDKFSATVDAELLADVRAHAGPRGVSAFVAEALRHELERVRLRELLTELADELGPPDEDMVGEALDAVRGIVAVTALRERPALVLTGDPDDLVRLVGDDPAVRVQPLP